MNNKQLPEELYAQLPELLHTPCLSYTDTADKELSLVAMLNIMGGALNKYYGTYNGKKIYPTLYTYIINNMGSDLQPLYSAFKVAHVLDEDHLKDYEYTLKRL